MPWMPRSVSSATRTATRTGPRRGRSRPPPGPGHQSVVARARSRPTSSAPSLMALPRLASSAAERAPDSQRARPRCLTVYSADARNHYRAHWHRPGGLGGGSGPALLAAPLRTVAPRARPRDQRGGPRLLDTRAQHAGPARVRQHRRVPRGPTLRHGAGLGVGQPALLRGHRLVPAAGDRGPGLERGHGAGDEAAMADHRHRPEPRRYRHPLLAGEGGGAARLVLRRGHHMAGAGGGRGVRLQPPARGQAPAALAQALLLYGFSVRAAVAA